MRSIMQRILALILVCLPVVLAIYGGTTLRDLFFEYTAGEKIDWLPLILGSLSLLLGIVLIGSFIFYREKKNYKVQDKLLTPEEQEEKKKNRKRGGNFLEKV